MVVGLSIVFSVLIIIMLVLYAFGAVFGEKKKAPAQQANKLPEAAPVKETKKADIDDEELIAVLTAAVAASLNTSTYNLQIKSYRRIGNGAPAWNRAGLNDTINSRF